MLAAFPVKLLGVNPIDYQSTRTILFDTVFVILFAVIGIAVGLLWNPRLVVDQCSNFLRHFYRAVYQPVYQWLRFHDRSGWLIRVLAGAAGSESRQPALVLLLAHPAADLRVLAVSGHHSGIDLRPCYFSRRKPLKQFRRNESSDESD